MLNKDKDKRPSIFEFAKIPCVSQKIEQFILENDCREEVMSFFEELVIDQESVPEKTNPEQDNKLMGYISDRLEDWVDIMRQNIPIKEHQNGWFSKRLRCAKGQDIFYWVQHHAEREKQKAVLICQKMLEKKLITQVDDKN